MIRKSIFYLFGTTILMAVCDAQAPAGSLPPDSEIRGILMQRVDEFHQSVGIVVGMIGPDGRKVVRYGAGRYQLAPNFVLTITREREHFFTQATGQPKFELFAESDIF